MRKLRKKSIFVFRFFKKQSKSAMQIDNKNDAYASAVLSIIAISSAIFST